MDPSGAERYRAILLMVHELHLRGYQRLRIAPGMAPSGMHWRCSVAPVSLISSSHGARVHSKQCWDPLIAHYTTGQGTSYFDWEDASHATPSSLATRFIERMPQTANAGKGSDWLYAGWYIEMLHLTYPNHFPIVYADWPTEQNSIPTLSFGGSIDGPNIPLPPPGEADEVTRSP